jgi:hypothetical protein
MFFICDFLAEYFDFPYFYRLSYVLYLGDKELNQCSGVIIGNDDNNTGIIFTSANLIRLLAKEEDVVAVNTIADDLKVIVF